VLLATRERLAGAIVMATCILVGCRTTPHVIDKGDSDYSVADVGRNATLTMMNSLHVQGLVRDGKTDEALAFIDSTYLHDVYLLMAFDSQIASEPSFLRLRNSIVVRLQRQWLQNPPQYIVEEEARYLERVCATIPECPAGRVRGRETPPVVPPE
jgi:hypothetical protein